MNNTGDILKNTNVIDTSNGEVDGQIKCTKCGASDISYNEKTMKLRCNYCRNEFSSDKVEENLDISELTGRTIGSGTNDIVEDAENIVTIKCGSCGADVVVDTSESLQCRCHWCRNYLSINNKLPNGAVPDMILPFSVTKEEASKFIAEFVGKRTFFAHPTFKKEFVSNNIMGVYFPYMVVDLNLHSEYDGFAEVLIRRYSVKVGKSTKTMYDADLYRVTRKFDLSIDNLTVESNVDKLNYKDENKTTNIINSIMPFDIENSVKWNANYLKGYTSERRDTNIEELEDLVSLQAKDISRHACNPSMKKFGRGVKWESEDVTIKGERWNAAYLPVWLYCYQQKNKDLHYVAVNARSKETMGSVPVDRIKLFLVTFFIEILCFISMVSIDLDGMEIFLLAGGFWYYFSICKKYRNSSARHSYEKDTNSKVHNLVGGEMKIKTLYGLSNSRISGQNNLNINDKTFQQLAQEKLGQEKK